MTIEMSCAVPHNFFKDILIIEGSVVTDSRQDVSWMTQRTSRTKFMTSGTQEFNADVLAISFGLFSLSFLTLKINQSRGRPL